MPPVKPAALVSIMFLHCYPAGIDGCNLGNVGYTYISTVEIDSPIPPHDEDDTSSVNISNAESEVADANLADILALEFEIYAEPDQYMLRATESGGESFILC